MDEILTRCGYRCDLCLAYQPNVQAHPENQVILSDGWFKYFGFRVPPEKILCDGCMQANPHLLDQECPVRPCVLAKGIDHCAQCDEYVCPKLKERLVVFAEIQAQHKEEIPTADYVRFIQPYENFIRLEALRSGPKREGE